MFGQHYAYLTCNAYGSSCWGSISSTLDLTKLQYSCDYRYRLSLSHLTNGDIEKERLHMLLKVTEGISIGAKQLLCPQLSLPGHTLLCTAKTFMLAKQLSSLENNLFQFQLQLPEKLRVNILLKLRKDRTRFKFTMTLEFFITIPPHIIQLYSIFPVFVLIHLY